ncbi:hypothetical protein AgCh_026207 [Apium graveolens]
MAALDYETINKNVKKAQYAVRGELYVRASELQKEGKKPISVLPISEPGRDALFEPMTTEYFFKSLTVKKSELKLSYLTRMIRELMNIYRRIRDY